MFSYPFQSPPLFTLFFNLPYSEQVWHLFNLQVIDYYAKKGVLAQLHAEKTPNEVTAEVQKVLSS